MNASRWSWLAVSLMLVGWTPPASVSLTPASESASPDDKWAEDFFLSLPEDLRQDLRHLAFTRGEQGRISRVVGYFGAYHPPPRPNPWLAAGFSLVVPGAGQAYGGDWPRGAMFFGTAVLLWGVAWGLRDSHPTLGNALGIGILGISLAAPIDAYLRAQSCDKP